MYIILSFIIGALIGSYLMYKWILSKDVEMINNLIDKELYEHEEDNNNYNSNNNISNNKE